VRNARFVAAALAVALLCSSGSSIAVRATEAQAAIIPVTLKLSIVISRFTGEKKTGSLPFQVLVIPGNGPDRDGEQTSLQTGARVPVPQTTFVPVGAGGAPTQPQTSYSYQQFGTNITASARAFDATTFNVGLNVTDSQLLSDSPDQAQYASGIRLPRYQSFTSSNRLVLRDGQTVQYTAASDKTSGEVIKLDVTLNVIK
jgi:hypothetical protein